MDYTPQSPKPPEIKPEYVLVEDVTKLPTPQRGPQTIDIVTYDKDNKRHVIKAQVPFAPNSSCKKCHGRGYVGFDVKTKRPLLCGKCYSK